MSGIGGLIGKGLKILGVGVILLSANVVYEIVMYLTGYGEVNYIIRHALTQLGFIFVAWGLIRLAKMVKSLNKK